MKQVPNKYAECLMCTLLCINSIIISDKEMARKHMKRPFTWYACKKRTKTHNGTAQERLFSK